MVAQPDVYLWDTNILVNYVRGNPLAQHIERVYGFLTQPTAPLISVVTEGEIASLTLQLGWGAGRRQRVQDLLGRLISVPLDYAGLIDAFARIDAHRRKIGVPMGDNDPWIAATAHATGARLITADKDFDHLVPTFLIRDWIDPKSFP